MKKMMKAVAALMLMMTVVFAAGCTKNDNPDNGGNNNGGSGGNNHAYVDLGLPSGTLWATCNVGANSPKDYGDYFSWAETAPKENYFSTNYKWYVGDRRLTKYCVHSHIGFQGFVDGLTVLLPEDDAATVNWGTDWCIPSYDQWKELYENTTHTWKKQNGVYGRLFTASNGKTLFLPAAGGCANTGAWAAGDFGLYWSNSLYSDDSRSAWYFDFSESNYQMDAGYARSNGFRVRPVRSAQ